MFNYDLLCVLFSVLRIKAKRPVLKWGWVGSPVIAPTPGPQRSGSTSGKNFHIYIFDFFPHQTAPALLLHGRGGGGGVSRGFWSLKKMCVEWLCIVAVQPVVASYYSITHHYHYYCYYALLRTTAYWAVYNASLMISTPTHK